MLKYQTLKRSTAHRCQISFQMVKFLMPKWSNAKCCQNGQTHKCNSQSTATQMHKCQHSFLLVYPFFPFYVFKFLMPKCSTATTMHKCQYLLSFVCLGLSLRTPFHMLPTELTKHPPMTCDVMLSCMLDGVVSKMPVFGRLYLTNFRLVFLPHFFNYEDRNLKVRE